MDVIEAIHARRSIKEFADRPVDRERIDTLLDAAVRAPNHRMTEPWRFIVLGPDARRSYAEIRAGLKAEKVDDASAADAVREKVLRRTLGIPALLAIAQAESDDPEIREEDYAATWMAVQNVLLAAVDVGLGGYIHTGRILRSDGLRRLLDVADDERVVAVVDLGEPAEAPSEKARTPAYELTRWLP